MSKVKNKYSWPLAVSPFTILDRLAVAWWVATQDRYTMGQKVAELEQKFSDFSGGRHAVMVSSGSTANHLVFELWKIKNPGVKPVVICPAVTWMSSISPATMAGLDVVFCDINLTDFSLDLTHLNNLLDTHKDRRVIIWPTALIGFTPNMDLIHRLAARHGEAEVFLDACENTLGHYPDGKSILASADMVTTSTYLSHYICSVEGGFVFFKHERDADIARMFRNHGMTRSLSTNNPIRRRYESFHSNVDPRFLFAVAGTNFRSSDVHAAFGLRDFERIHDGYQHRKEIYELFYNLLDKDKYYLPELTDSHVAFCLPIFVKESDERMNILKDALEWEGIETRPIIGSHLGYQPCLNHLFERPIDRNYPNAEWVHRRGFYIGLHHKVTEEMVEDLVLNTLNVW